MIIADTNLIAYLLIPGPYSDAAQRVLERDSQWIAPAIWQHEFLNVLATSVREGYLPHDRALNAWAHAPAFIEDAEVPPLKVLDLAILSKVGTYDCYFVVLAQMMNAPLVTNDKQLLKQFGDVAVSIEQFGKR